MRQNQYSPVLRVRDFVTLSLLCYRVHSTHVVLFLFYYFFSGLARSRRAASCSRPAQCCTRVHLGNKQRRQNEYLPKCRLPSLRHESGGFVCYCICMIVRVHVVFTSIHASLARFVRKRLLLLFPCKHSFIEKKYG